MDDIDMLCPHRSGGNSGSGGTEVQKRIVTCLLSLLDGVSPPGLSPSGLYVSQVLLIATSSKPQMIDSALRRPGM